MMRLYAEQIRAHTSEKTNESVSWCHPRPLPAHIACSESALNVHCAVPAKMRPFPTKSCTREPAAAAFGSPMSIRRFRTRVEDYTKSHAASHSVTLHLLAAFWHRPCHGTRIWSYCTPRLEPGPAVQGLLRRIMESGFDWDWDWEW
jgi:hypothetical protein